MNYFKKISAFILSFILLFICVFSFSFPVKASDLYHTIYEGFDYSDVISQHTTFTFTDKGGGKHTVYKATSTSSWICLFGGRQIISDDSDLNYYLSWYSYEGYKTSANSFMQFLSSKLGILSKGTSNLVEECLANTSSFDIDYNDSTGLIISSDSVDKLRDEIKNQYYENIGAYAFKSYSDTIPQQALNKFSSKYEYQEDFVSDFNSLEDCKYYFQCNLDYFANSFELIPNFDNPYFYLVDNRINCVDDSLQSVDFSFKPYLISSSLDYYSYISLDTTYLFKYTDTTTFSDKFKVYYYYKDGGSSWMPFTFYSSSKEPFVIFKSYEALYNYVNGSQTAYLGSKVNEASEDITLSINDMNSDICGKMDELIENINNNKSSMSAEDLQNAIDKGLESLTGKIEEIGENTDETNKKLDQVNDTLSGLSSLISEQNKILLDILGVTEYIAYNTTKEDGSSYTFDDVSASFDSLFNGVEYAFLYGINIFGSSGYSDSGGTSTYLLANNVSAVALYSDDSGAVDDTSEDLEETLDYHNGILGKFPFSVPYQLYEWLQVLCCEPVTPTFEYKYGFLIGQKDNESLSVSISMAQFDDWFKVSRSFLKLSFTLLLSVGIYHRFKGEF